eukprot:Colp12_sorted_trinity150504_noHs@30793
MVRTAALRLLVGILTICIMASSATRVARNVLGTELQLCCLSPRTGFMRDGFCRTNAQDHGRHLVCAQVTDEFLRFTRSRGNDLMTPAPHYQFPGLKDGDKWCLCVLRWKEALDAGVAPPVVLEATHENSLKFVTIENLKAHAVQASEKPCCDGCKTTQKDEL